MDSDKNYRIKPCHYQNGSKDLLDLYADGLIPNQLSSFEIFVIGNIIKYLTRYHDKNGLNDLEKASEYNHRLIEYSKNRNVIYEFITKIKNRYYLRKKYQNLFKDWFTNDEYSQCEKDIINKIVINLTNNYPRSGTDILFYVSDEIHKLIMIQKKGIITK